MKGSLVKTGFQIKKAALSVGLFLAVFVAIFYLVNLDTDPERKPLLAEEPVEIVDIDAELKKRLSGISFPAESYEYWSTRYSLEKKKGGLDADLEKDGLSNFMEYVHGTDPLKADTDLDSYPDKEEIANGYDPASPGDAKPAVEISILKIGAIAPMVWSKSEVEKDMLQDLEKGVSHFAKTSAPGQNGNMIISGHSSNYVWAKGDYNHVFQDLEKLEVGDMVTAKTVQKNGRIIVYNYKVSEKYFTVPNDERIFAQTDGPTLTLTSCWPVGTTLKRTIIKAELVR